jgi:peptidoglycan/xylan/chitin deacetylase (PgdA/CDA1 family)
MDTLHSVYAANTPARFWRLVTEPEVSPREWESAVSLASSTLPAAVLHCCQQGQGPMTAVLSEAQFGSARWRLGAVTQLYYRLKPVIPRQICVGLRQRYCSLQRSRSRLNWPVEERYARFQFRAAQAVIGQRDVSEMPFIHFWPGDHQLALVLTHDVETAQGQSYVREVAALEERYGFVSSFNFVTELYPLDLTLIAELRERGFEVGVHGLRHDGKLFLSPGRFQRRAERINRTLCDLSAVGYRSPLQHRHPGWLQALDIEYDLSFFDTDPYEPMPGGTMSIWPFFLGRFVELPYTLAQDHTLMVILGAKTPRMWLEKVDFIRRFGGMALLNSHPDYLRDQQHLAIYEEFLHQMHSQGKCWNALPREVARWWCARAEAKVERKNGQWIASDLPGATIKSFETGNWLQAS